MERSSSSSMQNGTSPLSNLRKSQRLDVFQGILQGHNECLEDQRSMRKRHNNPGAGANAGISTSCMVADSNPCKHGKEPEPVDGIIVMLQGKERGNRKAPSLQMDEMKVPSTLVDIGSNADEVGIPLGQSARMEVEVNKVSDHVSSEDHVNSEMNAQIHARRELQEETFDKGGNADGARAEAAIGAGKLCLLVDLGDMECMVDSTHISNQCFTKAELADWWHAKGSSVPDTEHLKTKLRERQAWA